MWSLLSFLFSLSHLFLFILFLLAFSHALSLSCVCVMCSLQWFNLVEVMCIFMWPRSKSVQNWCCWLAQKTVVMLAPMVMVNQADIIIYFSLHVYIYSDFSIDLDELLTTLFNEHLLSSPQTSWLMLFVNKDNFVLLNIHHLFQTIHTYPDPDLWKSLNPRSCTGKTNATSLYIKRNNSEKNGLFKSRVWVLL